MTRQPHIARRAEELLGSAVAATAPVAGGDIATATKLRLSSGRSAFMKTLTSAPEGCRRDGSAGWPRRESRSRQPPHQSPGSGTAAATE